MLEERLIDPLPGVEEIRSCNPTFRGAWRSGAFLTHTLPNVSGVIDTPLALQYNK
jgi:hypothetical protein